MKENSKFLELSPGPHFDFCRLRLGLEHGWAAPPLLHQGDHHRVRLSKLRGRPEAPGGSRQQRVGPLCGLCPQRRPVSDAPDGRALRGAVRDLQRAAVSGEGDR